MQYSASLLTKLLMFLKSVNSLYTDSFLAIHRGYIPENRHELQNHNVQSSDLMGKMGLG
jgi:hypothetical protein